MQTSIGASLREATGTSTTCPGTVLSSTSPFVTFLLLESLSSSLKREAIVKEYWSSGNLFFHFYDGTDMSRADINRWD